MTRAGLAGAALLALCLATAASAAVGDRRGIVLLGRVQRAYRTVPGVATSVRSPGFVHTGRIVLRSGVVVATEEISRTSLGKEVIVQRIGGPIFERKAGRKCWRRLRIESPYVGLPFPALRNMRVWAPKTTAKGWRFKVAAHGTRVVYAIARNPLRLDSILPTDPTTQGVEHVQALQYAPRIAVPSPRC